MRAQPLLAFLLVLPAACSSPPAAQPPRASTIPIAAPALRAYRDPTTGAFGEPPPGVAPTLPSAPTAARAPMTEAAAPGGGRMIRLNGAFRSQMVGHTDAANTTTISCSTKVAP